MDREAAPLGDWLELTEKPRVDEAGEPVLDENDEQIIDTVSPIAVGPDMITLDNENAKVGQLPGAALDGSPTRPT